MKVRTIDGGFRGLGLAAVSQDQISTQLDRLNNSVQPFDEAYAMLTQAANAGQLSVFERSLLTDAEQLRGQIAQQVAAADSVNTDSAFTAWKRRTEALIASAASLARNIRTTVGLEQASRGFKLALIAIASVTLLGGSAWVIYRYSKKKRRR